MEWTTNDTNEQQLSRTHTPTKKYEEKKPTNLHRHKQRQQKGKEQLR